MGTALCAQLASTSGSRKTGLAQHVMALVAICPVSGPPDEKKTSLFRKLLWIPGWLFGLWRIWDGIGGPYSPSVSRFVGEQADPELRTMQYRFNQQSRTPVWRRMAYGSLPAFDKGIPVGGLPGLDTWANIDVPVYLIAGENDHLTPPAEVEKIIRVLGGDKENSHANSALYTSASKNSSKIAATSLSVSDATTQVGNAVYTRTDEDLRLDTSSTTMSDNDNDPSTPIEEGSTIVPPQPAHPAKVVRSFVMPAPANHTLLYMPQYSRVLAGLISDFLATHVTQRLSLTWQLQYLSREGKWDVKNLNKWKSVTPVSLAIGRQGKPIFRAMKTLREVDDFHCPSKFVERWGSVIKVVVDISKDQPVYDPRGLERGSIQYHKFPTVSKIPPQPDEVESFIQLVDRLRETLNERAVAEGWEYPERCVVGVHCHYGFNRTGYFIVCYLVERCGFRVQEAIEEFARARPNGIRHSHFLDRLYVRYNVEMG
ncbi:hypothetical protein UVI_02002770 [Ustilaginoidea virens]|nr:hypothetical protein UVI_02002770 [Ustilaginoidea virens]